jgi:hypothetical protein
MIATLLALLIVYAWKTPLSPIGRQMNGFAMAIAQRLSRIRPIPLALCLVVIAALTALVLYAKMEGLMIAAPAGADSLALLLSVDVGTYVEVVAVAWLLGAAGAFRSAMQVARTIIRRRPAIVRTRRARRSTRRPSVRPPRADPGEDAHAATGITFALAA